MNVLYGSAAGLSATGNQLWNENVAGVPGKSEHWDTFGAALAAGDLDGDGRDDLAIGIPGEDPRGAASLPFGAGAVVVLYGMPDGLATAGVQRWTQDSPGVPGSVEKGDSFGATLAIANYGRSGRADLAIGVPRETLARINHAGMVDVLYGRSSGLSGRHAQGWSQKTKGVRGKAKRSEYFSETLVDSRSWP